jgi:hypothetical protein
MSAAHHGLAEFPAGFFDWPIAKRLAWATPIATKLVARKQESGLAEFFALSRPLLPLELVRDGRVIAAKRSVLHPRRQEFIAAFNHAAAHPPPMPHDFRYSGPGIVICAGGWKYAIGAYVACGMLRDVTDLPIQIWHHGGEINKAMGDLLRRWPGVEIVDAVSVAAQYPMDSYAGWPLKSLAVIASPFSTVWSFDADCYPVAALDRITAAAQWQDTGATFWPDLDTTVGNLTHDQWQALGMDWRAESAWESGLFAVDKRRHWRSLWLAWWLNSRSIYTYQILHGDKDTFHLAWRKHDAAVAMPVERPAWYRVGFLHEDFSGQPFAVHRVKDKPRFPLVGGGEQFAYGPPGKTIELGDQCRRVEGLPREDRFWELLDECRDSCRRLGVAK